MHSFLAMQSIALLGSEAQRTRWLPEMARLEEVGAFGLTEPRHGSDAVGLGTSARRDGDSYVLDGRNKWIGNGLADAGRMTAAMASLAKMNNAAKARAIVTDARDLLGGDGILLGHHVAPAPRRHGGDLHVRGHRPGAGAHRRPAHHRVLGDQRPEAGPPLTGSVPGVSGCWSSAAG